MIKRSLYESRNPPDKVLDLCCLASGFSPAIMADTLSHIKETQTVTIAHREASLPFSYLPDSKLPTGYAVDICLKFVDAIKKELKAPNLKVHYLLVTPSSRIPAIIEGKADMECGSTTNNAERRKQVSFTIPISLHRRACWCVLMPGLKTGSI
jgi:glutamate/aspartate transport system substrate-binding protein